MKRKLLNLTLSLIYIFTMAAIVVPAGVAMADYSDYTPANYDVRYVAKYADDLNGTNEAGHDGTGDGSIDKPWRSITMAVDQLPYNSGGHMKDPFGTAAKPDMIVVGRSFPATGGDGYYGGSNAENILIDNPVILVSMYGRDNTIINVSGQTPIPGGVIEITSSNVIVDDFTIVSNGGGMGLGASCGVYAHGSLAIESDYIEDVHVLNCHIKIDEYMDGVGIEMFRVKYPIICGNDIDVGVMGGELDIGPTSINYAYGIIMYDCFTARICDNELDVEGLCLAVGIEMDTCPKSLVGIHDDTPTPGPNDIEVLAGSDVMAFGIKVFNSPLIDIMHNMVTVEATGDYFALGYGIKVWYSDRSDVIDNTVYVEVNLPDSFIAGFSMGRGIALKACNGPNRVADNSVTVLVTGYVSESIDMAVELEEDIAEDVSEFEPILLQSLGIDQSFVMGMASGVGISIKGCPATAVTGNDPVSVTLDVDIISGDELIATGHGGGCAIGISGLGSPGINVSGNMVTVLDDVFAQVIARYVQTAQFAIAGAKSVALGIILDCSPGAVVSNSVNADADIEGDIKAEEVTGTSGAEGSAIARFDSEILGAINLHLNETLESEEVDIDIALSGDLPSLQTWGSGDAAAVGIGIMVMNSYVVAVTGNAPVSGTGDVELSVLSSEIGSPPAIACGGGMGLGIGIAIIDTRGATVSANQGVNGAGTADVDVGAVHDTSPTWASATGGGAGIGIGILLCGMQSFEMEAFELPEDQHHWMDRPMVTNNAVSASGIAEPIIVTATELTESHESCAYGGGLGLALGIAAVWYPCIEISGNTVVATADADVDIDSEAVHDFDPTSVGGAAGIGIGILTVNCFHAQILDNMTEGLGTAEAMVGATENWLDQSSWGFGGAMGMGAGIVVAMSPASLVSGNTAYGWGDAYCKVTAISYIPLSEAYAFSLATGVGKGIAVMWSPCTNVIRCNTAAGEGTARVEAEYDADFGWAGSCGFAGSFDILMKLIHVHPYFLEEDVDDLGSRHRHGVVNYNSIVDPPISLGTGNVGVDVMDAGLLKVGHPPLDATLNWWNDPTGPSGFGPGFGEAVYWCGFHPHPVCFMPWLYVVHTEVLEEQIGKFGFFVPMTKGLNTFSTPIALEEGVIPSRTWDDILANNPGLAGNIKWVLSWDSGYQMWQSPLGTDPVDPLHAFYIYMLSGTNIILYVNSDSEHEYAMPTRELPDEWSLVGPNPQWPPWPGMFVRPALTSILLTPDALPGYTQAISPNVFSQPPWVFVPSMPGPGPMMLAGRGYWVWMENLDTLVGFGFSPLPAGP